MAAEPNSQSDEQNKVADEVREDSRRSDAGQDAPFSGDVKSPDELRGQQVGEPVTSSFDERTGVTQPFVLQDGTQDNGAVHPEEAEGARRVATREGDQTVVEDTKEAIEDGVVEGSVAELEALENDEHEAPLNPVATEHDTGASDEASPQGNGDEPATTTPDAR